MRKALDVKKKNRKYRKISSVQGKNPFDPWMGVHIYRIELSPCSDPGVSPQILNEVARFQPKDLVNLTPREVFSEFILEVLLK